MNVFKYQALFLEIVCIFLDIINLLNSPDKSSIIRISAQIEAIINENKN